MSTLNELAESLRLLDVNSVIDPDDDRPEELIRVNIAASILAAAERQLYIAEGQAAQAGIDSDRITRYRAISDETIGGTEAAYLTLTKMRADRAQRAMQQAVDDRGEDNASPAMLAAVDCLEAAQCLALHEKVLQESNPFDAISYIHAAHDLLTDVIRTLSLHEQPCYPQPKATVAAGSDDEKETSR